jgi:hypothetical protein
MPPGSPCVAAGPSLAGSRPSPFLHTWAAPDVHRTPDVSRAPDASRPRTSLGPPTPLGPQRLPGPKRLSALDGLSAPDVPRDAGRDGFALAPRFDLAPRLALVRRRSEWYWPAPWWALAAPERPSLRCRPAREGVCGFFPAGLIGEALHQALLPIQPARTPGRGVVCGGGGAAPCERSEGWGRRRGGRGAHEGWGRPVHLQPA